MKRKNPNQAILYYRSALTGLWHGRGAQQRFEVRLELAKYLMSLGRNTEAQGDLLTAEGNSLDHPADLLEIADLLQRAGDASDAWTTYRRVEVQAGATPAQVIEALRQEANVALSMGQYKRAAQAMERYLARARSRRAAVSEADRHQVAQQLERVRRMIQLIPFYGLSPNQRAERVMAAAQIAHARYVECSTSLQHAGAVAPSLSADDAAALTALDTEWQQMSSEQSSQLAGDPAGQKAMLDWVNRTENLTARLCGPPSGDDALLLQLAQVPDKSE